MDPLLLSAAQVARALSIGVSTWWEWVSEGRVKRGSAIGPRKTVWSAQYIRELAEEMLEKGKPEKGRAFREV